jgi:hypothetical protein
LDFRGFESIRADHSKAGGVRFPAGQKHPSFMKRDPYGIVQAFFH